MKKPELIIYLSEYKDRLKKWLARTEDHIQRNAKYARFTEVKQEDWNRTLPHRQKVMEEYFRIDREIIRLKASPKNFNN